MLWPGWRRRDRQHLITDLEQCRGRIGRGLRRQLSLLDPLELAPLLIAAWPRLGPDIRSQLVSLAEEEGFVDRWLELLARGRAGARVTAATILGEMEVGRALGPLLEALGEREEGVQLAATAALIRLRDPRCLEPLLAALAEPRRWPPARVAEILLALGPVSIPPLLALLKQSAPELAVRVIAILGLFKDPRTLPDLEDCLQKGPAPVRAAAARALGEMGLARAAPLLQLALADPEAGVRAAAARALGRLKYRQARKQLQACLDDGAWEVRAAAAAALQEVAAAREI
ncbi:HEAT repeat domain-containing protein [Neomoorella thermoacetica]|uniref:HEAT repeat domain-containing protein n=1 Tax=Neomoorella thermoacetica TaxID=1525 RepID=UPI0008FACD76|nr:HEAT repeat domain-containing protein [Moorella thermoacetica]OIQ11991.1 PBS lyase HEAT-like repeat protein [Moorella thermoacetica]OIQ62230.1 PBS lyase HEAT-like repeat protein [Moorella thermoacetica]